MSELFGYKVPSNAVLRAEKELHDTGRYICEQDLEILEMLLRDWNDKAPDGLAEYAWRAVAELRRLRHKLGESDLSMLVSDYYGGDTKWPPSDIARSTPDEKFRRYLEAIATRGIDSEDIQVASGLSYEDFKNYSALLVDERLLKFAFAV